MKDRILIVEDDPDIRHALAMFLRFAGYETMTAANGQEAIDLLEDHAPPRLIILDLMMPVMDGWTFRQLQLTNSSLAEIPVVIVSGAANIPQEAVLLNACGYLVKPFTLEAVVETVKRHCPAA
ncbi:MAG: response regulator [Bradymonadaceae bacterium]|nr:response regulator [Lujinxingiaceae bacterium]